MVAHVLQDDVANLPSAVARIGEFVCVLEEIGKSCGHTLVDTIPACLDRADRESKPFADHTVGSTIEYGPKELLLGRREQHARWRVDEQGQER